MRKSEIDGLRKKTRDQISKEADLVRVEIGKMILELKVNPPKDTNLLVKKKRRLAVLLTLLAKGKD